MLAEQITTGTPKQKKRLFFCNSGAEAVEAGMKVARGRAESTSVRERKPGALAAFIVEPIQGKGVYELDAERWRELEDAVHAAGALFIADEVQTGLGRTGAFSASEHSGFQTH